jgi:hypothetical protein
MACTFLLLIHTVYELSKRMKTTKGQNHLIILLDFLGLGAIGGGVSLIISPDGHINRDAVIPA